MEWSKLKNIILILLLTVNAFLLVLVLDRQTKSQRYEVQSREAVIAILSDNGIAMDRTLLPPETGLSTLTVLRDEETESSQAAALLGGNVQAESDGTYTGTVGRLRFYPDGAFSFSAAANALPLEGQAPVDFALTLLSTLDVESVLCAGSEGDSSVELSLLYQGIPVFAPRDVSVTFQGDYLVSAEGYHISGATPALEESLPLSVPTVLLSFLSHLKENRTICREITAMVEGYQLVTVQGGQPRLVPTWHISTDTGDYYLNAFTGIVL